MIPYSEFGRLRLGDFVPADDIEELSNWEYGERLWVGEAVGFSEWLRLEEEPEVLRSVSLDFSDFPGEAAARVLQAIGLPVRPGMSFVELTTVLGDPVRTLTFTPHRKTFEFTTTDREPYHVSCTVLNDGGLTYLGIMTQLPDSAA